MAGKAKSGRSGCACTRAYGSAEASCGRGDYGVAKATPYQSGAAFTGPAEITPTSKDRSPGTPVRRALPILDSAGSEVEGRV